MATSETAAAAVGQEGEGGYLVAAGMDCAVVVLAQALVLLLV
jgi:hypothetical protein